MDIRNSNFSADERLLLNFILSRPFPERAEAIRFLNSLTSGEIVRDYSPHARILEFRTKDILPGYSSGMRELITAQVPHPNGRAPSIITLYEKDGWPFEFEIYNADHSEIHLDLILSEL